MFILFSFALTKHQCKTCDRGRSNKRLDKVTEWQEIWRGEGHTNICLQLTDIILSHQSQSATMVRGFSMYSNLRHGLPPQIRIKLHSEPVVEFDPEEVL